MSAIFAKLTGGFGNQMFIYAYSRAYAEQNGHELCTVPWVGEKIFTLDGIELRRPDGSEVELAGYRQNQESLIYTRADCRRWFKLKPEIETLLARIPAMPQVAHYRGGDYFGYNYPVVSRDALRLAAKQHGCRHGLRPAPLAIASEENAQIARDLPDDLSFLPDFLMLVSAKQYLFRANSSFSWWAAVLNETAEVWSPVITGLKGGIEHDNVSYVEGNWPKLVELDGITDLHLPE